MKVLGIQQQQVVEDSMQSLTSGTGETTVFSSQQSPLASQNPLPAKKRSGRRSLTGNSAPEAEVIALSPKTLMATNRFVCEICNKGFRRDQNLQLHRRRHNLPWKLKQKTGKQVRKKVYICPEVSCVHHDPCRALGDLTGIKKHFSRKHGEKKWKCDKCSKKYAVQCDWKAHCKICGTREYRCGCGTLFIRRDSFVTHRAFCDALAEESARVATANFVDNQHRLLFPQPEHSTLPPTTAQNKISDFMRTAEVITTTTGDDGHLDFSIKGEEQDQHLNMKPWQPSRNHMGVFPYICPYKNQSPYLSSHKTSANSPHLSATALLQKAAQTGATMSRTQHKAQMAAHSSTATGFGLGWPSHRDMSCSGGNSVHGLIPPVTFLQDMVSLPSATGLGGSCERLFNGMLGSKREETSGVDSLKRSHGRNEGGRGVCVRDGFARGFLSDGQFCDREMLKMAGMDSTMNSFFL